MASKIFRDPLYNYISIDVTCDRWLVDLLDTPEIQRLRRIHQLGVSDYAYPGASHTRFSHTLGVLHLMQRVYDRINQICTDRSVKDSQSRLLAAAVLHDVGHGPFSHLFEPCLGIDHEEWSVKIIKNPEGQIFKTLSSKFEQTFPELVSKLIEKDNYDLPQWQKSLLSSQLDVDRMDYLRRDSLFTGAGYGHFDWFRIINTLELDGGTDHQWDIVWPEKAKFAIEEYIFARYYMYQNVYLHKTTRGFEKILEAMWKHAKKLYDEETDVKLVPAIKSFWDSKNPSVEQYLSIEEYTVLHQIQIWKDHTDSCLSDLATRFLNRERFAMIEGPPLSNDLDAGYEKWEEALQETVRKSGFGNTDIYCLRDQLKGKYNQPYFPEKEKDEQSAKTAIRIKLTSACSPEEISNSLPRLKPITTESQDRYRYYIPQEARDSAEKLKEEWLQK